MTAIIGTAQGITILNSMLMSFAPSMRADSLSDSGMPWK